MGRHPSRTREEFIATAMRRVDADGLDRLSLRDIGRDLGVAHSAVYTHFADKQALVDALVDRMTSEIVDAGPLAGSTPREVLRDLSLRSYHGLARHPRLIPAYLGSSGDVGSTHVLTRLVLAQLEASGLSGRTLALAQQALEGYVIGAILWDHGGAPRHLATRRDRYRASEHPASDTIVDDEAMAAFNEEAFLFGLDRLLDGLGVDEQG